MDPSVVKLGGSLAHSADLPDWLAVLAEQGAGRAVLVPGGGPFADTVRSAQAIWHFNDATAHHMALLAMQQYGLMLGGLRAELLPVASEAAIRAALAGGRIPVWSPLPMALDPELETSWRLTSDSLAAWLARRLNAGRLALVKRCTMPDSADPADWAAVGIVDPLFPEHARGLASTLCCSPARLARWLADQP
jgi:5-(aminomethyl)-3-furanmethanol phosphate kinase